MDVTICIASYRRPEGLARLFGSLARMKLPDGVRVEIVVVDNDPDAPAVQPLPDAGGLPARRLREPERNIALARNAAIAAARGAWLAFVDDDETVSECWLAAFLAEAERERCDGCFGPVGARAEQPEAGGTHWLALFTGAQRPPGKRLPLEAARTSNAFVRRALIEALRFDPAFGRSGGSDTVLFRELMARGAQFRWCDAASVEEWLPRQRLSARWLLRRAFRGGYVLGVLARRGSQAQIAAAALRAALGLPLAAALLPLGCAGGRVRALRALMRVVSALGRIHGLCGGRFAEYAG